MKKGRIIKKDSEIKEILEQSKSIAVLGLSSNPEKDSYHVAEYLINHNYKIIPVRPGSGELFGSKIYENLDLIEDKIDILDVFRRSELIMDHVDEAIRLKPAVFWMQLGIKNEEAAEKLVQNGINVIMDRCIKIEYARLCR